jgi:hypothetical protein
LPLPLIATTLWMMPKHRRCDLAALCTENGEGSMGRTRGRFVEAKIRRLLREITEIDELFYHQDKAGDRDQYAAMLERNATT